MNFPDKWIHGAFDCRVSGDPIFQIHPFDETTFIIRQNKCSNFEGPFLYLIVGDDTAFLLDSGAAPEDNPELPIVELVDSTLERIARERGQETIKLIVGHSHAHADHAFGDALFRLRANTVVVPRSINAMRRIYSISDWENDLGNLNLGNRALTIIPTPGHEEQHICIYDHNTKILFSGDMLYAGKLVVNEWFEYIKSVRKITKFTKENELSFILGAHIEMKNTPRELYPIPTIFQPDEHVLQLEVPHLLEWSASCLEMEMSPEIKVHSDFVIFPTEA